MQNYIDRINNAKAIWELDRIIDEAANDEGITNKEYCNLYELAMNVIRSWH